MGVVSLQSHVFNYQLVTRALSRPKSSTITMSGRIIFLVLYAPFFDYPIARVHDIQDTYCHLSLQFGTGHLRRDWPLIS